MTQRLYYSEAYRRSFDGKVLTAEPVAHLRQGYGGQAGQTAVVLDQTAFYPTSGGQPFDTGTLGGAAVTDVIDGDDGVITHIVSGALNPGDVVSGEIDWARRFDHMQQHTGQHVLSAAFDRLFGVRTESFHLGQLSATIDLAREVSAGEIARAEDDANRVVWEDRPVTVRFATAEEAAAMPLRKESGRTGSLRLIDVHDYDLSACGGTHVERTGAIGVIAIGGWEKFKGGSRVEFLCGGRALQRFRVWRESLSAMQKHLSVPPIEMAASLERMQDDAKSSQRTIRSFQEKLATHEAQSVVTRGRRIGDLLVIAESLDGWDAQGLKAIAVAASAAQSDALVALFSSTMPAQVVIARGANARVDANALLKQLAGLFGGKGGGKPDLAQGGGLNANGADLVDAVHKCLAVP
jgi:alanyl-tRNA synthetase